MKTERTDEWEEYWTDYIRDIASSLRLKDWIIKISERVPDEGNSGEIDHIDGRRRGFLALPDEWGYYTPEEQRHTIVHELLHLHHIMASNIVEGDLAMILRKDVHLLLIRNYRRQMEYMVDTLADVIAPFLPLPSSSFQEIN